MGPEAQQPVEKAGCLVLMESMQAPFIIIVVFLLQRNLVGLLLAPTTAAFGRHFDLFGVTSKRLT